MTKNENLITITTDFGDSFAPAQLRAVLTSLRYAGEVIENHGVTPYSVLEGAFQILILSKFTPPNSVHVGVVDPGVRSKRKGIVIKTDNFYFVGPNNGILFPVADKNHIISVWQLQELKISKKISNTFHGRDVFIKVAAYLAEGKLPESFGALKIPKSIIEKIAFKAGQVLYIDSYGNIKIHWPRKINVGEKLLIKIGKRKHMFPIVKTFSDVQSGKPLALLGSSNTLELAVNLGSAETLFKTKVENLIDISSLKVIKQKGDN